MVPAGAVLALALALGADNHGGAGFAARSILLGVPAWGDLAVGSAALGVLAVVTYSATGHLFRWALTSA